MVFQRLKISIGMNLQSGAWGGGNQFGHSLKSYLEGRECDVYFDLDEPDLDIILLTEPRFKLASSAYSYEQIAAYLKYKNKKTIVIHRINECDERKGTKGVNDLLVKASRYADHTVFISSFLKHLFVNKGINESSSSIILNGGDTNLFNRNGSNSIGIEGPLKLITHHWGGNWSKGFDIYERLDKMLSEKKWSDQISFTFVGSLPNGFQFINANYIKPLSGNDLGDEISRHHIYLTASRNEPAGMHHIEGALCGLPLLYIESGALPEYCNGFGISFNTDNFELNLKKMIRTYDHWGEKMSSYPHTSEKMCSEYYSLFMNLFDKRDDILRCRKPLPRISIFGETSYHYKEIKKIIKSSSKVVLGTK